jgi:hypothetical protein
MDAIIALIAGGRDEWMRQDPGPAYSPSHMPFPGTLRMALDLHRQPAERWLCVRLPR